jgi:hypothetical protein
MSLCIICHTHDATVPDRNTMSSKKRLCSKCHADRLKDDLRHILALAEKRTGIANAMVEQWGMI